MFVSEDFLQLVFANERDTYYCNGLLALNLEQYLWFRLHEQGYGCVYFLRYCEDSCQIVHFGERCAQSFDADHGSSKKLFSQKVKPSALQKWLFKQLRLDGGNRVAIVSSLQGFCRFFSEKSRLEILSQLSAAERRGTVLLVAPPEAEFSAPFFLHSPVFDALRETSITSLRTAAPCGLFAALQHDKPQRIHFLNVYTKEILSDLLSRVCVEVGATIPDSLLHHMQSYLLQWNNNPDFFRKEQGRNRYLPPSGAKYRILHDALVNTDAWDELVERGNEVAAYGNMQAYLNKIDVPFVHRPPNLHGLHRLQESYAGNCLRLTLPSAVTNGTRAADCERLLGEIKDALHDPKNRDANPKVVEAITRFLSDFRDASVSGDGETCYFVLFSIHFCMEQLYIAAGTETENAVEEIIHLMRDCVTFSKGYFSDLQDYRHSSGQADGNLTHLLLQQLSAKVDTSKRFLDHCKDSIQAAILQLKLANSDASIARLAERISEMIPSLSESIPASEEEVVPEPADDDIDYQIREGDYDYLPPVKQ